VAERADHKRDSGEIERVWVDGDVTGLVCWFDEMELWDNCKIATLGLDIESLGSFFIGGKHDFDNWRGDAKSGGLGARRRGASNNQ
jgi:hypothetical protein